MSNTDISTVTQLLDQRNQLQEWLTRLDELTPDSTTHVASRIRSDYQDRLETVLADLSTHVDGIREDAATLQTGLEAAGVRHGTAVDALEEMRLRHLIGELDDRTWGERRNTLDAEVATLAAARDEVAADLHRMEDLLAQIAGSAPPPPRPAPAPEIAEPAPWDPLPDPPVAEERIVDPPLLEPFAPRLEDSIAGFPEPEPAPTPLPFLGGRDFPWELPADDAAPRAPEPVPPSGDFLAELDRAMHDDSGETAPFTLTEAELDARPKRGVKCPDCGYTNDAQAWYCGVCGADLN